LGGNFHFPAALDPTAARAAVSAIPAADTAVPATTAPDLTRNSRLDTGIEPSPQAAPDGAELRCIENSKIPSNCAYG
jgi:hypothetical protein